MRICRFERDGEVRFGLIESVSGRETITRSTAGLSYGRATHAFDQGASCSIATEEVALRAPVQPSKIVCVGRNYREHASELGNKVPVEPLLFLKPPSSLLDPEAKILRPSISARVDYEGELGVIIGKRCRSVQADEDPRPYIFGYTCVNDVTARDLQSKDVQFTRAKGFDTFCPVGPVISDELDPWTGVEVETRVNGRVRQHGNTRELIFPLDAVIRHISQVMTLLPGDLISTGTPEGVGPLSAGDIVEVRVEGIGVLRNPVGDDNAS